MNEEKSLPSGWIEISLNDLCLDKVGLRRGPFGSAIKKSFFVPDGYKVYEQSNAIYDDVFRGNYFVSEEKYLELQNFAVLPGDFIVSCSGTLGKIAEIPQDAKHGIINQALLRIRLRENIIIKKFFLYVFRSASFQRNIFDQSQGTAMSNLIGIKDFKEVKIPLPPLAEQHRIVAKIEELFSSLDNGIQNLKNAQQQLKIYRQAVLKWAFEGKLTSTKNDNSQSQGMNDLPEGWQWVKTGEVIEIINNGYTPKKEFLFEGSGEIPFIKVYNLNFDGTLNFRKNPTFIPTEIHRTKLKRSICLPGDVLINIVGPPLGKVSIVTKQFSEWNINQAIVMFRPNKRISSKYLSLFLQNHVTIQWLENTSKRTFEKGRFQRENKLFRDLYLMKE